MGAPPDPQAVGSDDSEQVAVPASEGGEDLESESTELSSTGSLTRQMTEVSEAACADLMERQLSGFQNRSGEFWLRQCTTPAGLRKSQDQAVLVGLKRQLSCPAPSASRGGPRAGHPLESIKDVEVESNSGSGCRSRQVSSNVEDAFDEGLIETAICTVVTDIPYSVSVADPATMDNDLIAVSEGFLTMTGYAREDVIDKNCRFLNKGTDMAPELKGQLQEAVEKGAPFRAVLVNKKKSGQLFLNLLDLRGLVIARNDFTGEDIWLLVGVQQDVSHMTRESLPEGNKAMLDQVASRIRKRLVKHLNELGLSSAMCSFRLNPVDRKAGQAAGENARKCIGRWSLSSETLWRPGKVAKGAAEASLDEIPADIAQRFTLTRKAESSGGGGPKGLPQATAEAAASAGSASSRPAASAAPPVAAARGTGPSAGAGRPSAASAEAAAAAPVPAATQAAEPLPPVAGEESLEERYHGARLALFGTIGALVGLLIAARVLQGRQRR